VLRLSELGNRLKQEREEKNISLDDLQAITKIQKRYLIGIEEGNYSMIPGNFYVRAFIKQYAEAVNLNPEIIFEEYKNEVPSTYNDDLPEQLSRVKTHKELPKTASKLLELLPKLLTVAVIIVIAIVFWIWKQSAHVADPNNNDPVTDEVNDVEYETAEKPKPEENKNEEPVVEEQQDSQVEAEPETKPEEQVQKLTVKEVNGGATTYELTGTDKFELEVIAKGRTWVGIKNGKNKSFFGAEIPQGESKVNDFTAESEIKVRVGNVPGTDLKINGELLKYEDTKKTPQNITIIYNK
jgi:cytoskeletal protein RodZ